MQELGIKEQEIRVDFLPMGVVPIYNITGGLDGAFAARAQIAKEFKIETAISFVANKYYLRVSGMLYNTCENYKKLAFAVRKTLK